MITLGVKYDGGTGVIFFDTGSYYFRYMQKWEEFLIEQGCLSVYDFPME